MSDYPTILSQGKLIPKEDLSFPFEERGLQFGDGVYEVIRIYDGEMYLYEEHIERLLRSLEAIKIDFPFSYDDVLAQLNGLIEENGLTGDGNVYLQVSRGSAPRNHLFPEDVAPNYYAYLIDQARKVDALVDGVGAITFADERWKNCYIKSLNLLPNLMAKQAAHDAGCYEAILHEDGLVTECSSSNAYLVKDGRVYTHPTDGRILHGCVRMAVEGFCRELGVELVEEAFSLDDIAEADELFLSSSTSEVIPIVRVDDVPVADGRVGAVTRKLQRAYEKDAGLATVYGEQETVRV